MAINFKTEELLTLNQAANRLPKIASAKVHVSTLWRWCHYGLWGVHLEYLNIGIKIFTSTEALERFFIALTLIKEKPDRFSSKRPKVKKQKTALQNQRSIEDARAILIRAGIIQTARAKAATI